MGDNFMQILEVDFEVIRSVENESFNLEDFEKSAVLYANRCHQQPLPPAIH